MVRLYRLLAVNIVSSFLTVFSIQASVTIPASNTNIQYSGRFDFTNPDSVLFTWSGSTIRARFTGTSIGVNLTDGCADYEIVIDDSTFSPLITTYNTKSYTLANNLSNATHNITFVRRSECHSKIAVFKGFILDDGAKIEALPPKTNRRIEFIGDSYSVGFGNMSSNRECTGEKIRSTTNTYLSFGFVTARALNAEPMVVARSGIGIIRNYGDEKIASETPYGKVYGSTLKLDESTYPWNFSSWIPQVVVIYLGTNDLSTKPHPDYGQFKQAYHNLITRVMNNYADVNIICVGEQQPMPQDSLIKQIVSEEKQTTHGSRVHYARMPNDPELIGCSWHPTVADDKEMAKVLIDTIKSITGWENASTIRPEVKHFNNVNNRKNMYYRSVAITNGCNILRFSKPRTEVELFSTSGKLVVTLRSASPTTMLRLPKMTPGVYFVRIPNAM